MGGEAEAARTERELSQRGRSFQRTVFHSRMSLESKTGTRMVRLGNRLFFLEGFGEGVAQGRLMTLPLGSAEAEVKEVTGAAGSSHSSGLTDAWGIATDGDSLYLSTGFGVQGEGALVRVSRIVEDEQGVVSATYERIALEAGVLPNPSFMLIAEVDGGKYCYWSEYTASGNSGGRVRRVRLDGTGTVETVFHQLSFPAGLATDGTNLVVCESSGGKEGRVLKTALPYVGRALTPASPGVTTISSGTEAPIRRPFALCYDGSGGYLFCEGYTLDGSGLIGNTDESWSLRYLPRNLNTATTIQTGLGPCPSVRAVALEKGLTGGVLVSPRGVHRFLLRWDGSSPVTELMEEVGGVCDVLIEDPARPSFVYLSREGFLGFLRAK